MPDLVAVILLNTAVLGILAAVLIWWRNDAVFNYRMDLLSRVSDACIDDLRRGRYDDWHWRYQAFGAVSYNKMVYQFWRPLYSFYPDLRFAERGTRPMRELILEQER